MSNQITLEATLQSWFEECVSRVNNFGAADELWNAVLSRDEQIRLGDDFEHALNQYRTSVEMWMEVRTVDDPRIAVVEIAREIDAINPARAAKLLEALGGHRTLPNSDRPLWNRSRGQLLFRGKCVRKVRTFGQPSNIERVLDAFHSSSWPERIDRPSGFSRETVRDTVRSLKKGLTIITFAQQHGGTVIAWRTV